MRLACVRAHRTGSRRLATSHANQYRQRWCAGYSDRGSWQIGELITVLVVVAGIVLSANASSATNQGYDSAQAALTGRDRLRLGEASDQ
jgi:hypothetical protein